MLAKSPSFTAVAIATLALGIGANTAIFSVVSAVLLRPLPYPRPGELVRVTADLARQGVSDAGLSAPELFDYRAQGGLFQEICGIFPITSNITGGDRPERAEVVLADDNDFAMLGVKAQAGRVFGPEDRRPGIAEVAVINDGWWQRHYGADPRVIGKTLRLDDDLYTIIGVAPPGFRHPGRSIETDVEIWCPAGWVGPPFPATPARRGYFLRGAIARLAPGVTPAAAQSWLEALGLELRRQIGLAGAFLLTRAMKALLYGVSPRDPMTFGAIASLLGIVALAAAYPRLAVPAVSTRSRHCGPSEPADGRFPPWTTPGSTPSRRPMTSGARP